jgi:hypothetical protein
MKTIEFASPVFFDKKVQDLNTELESLGWIANQYPICYKGENEQGTYPEVYYNDGSSKNLMAMPEGNAMSFFTIEGDIIEIEEFHFSVPLALTVWADLTKVYPSKAYDYTGELIKDVIGVLQANSCNDLKIQTQGVFEDYSFLESKLQQNVMRPFTAFKISFECIMTKC